MIWTRERYIAHCLHEYTGREMFTELFGPLHALEAEWRSQGASEKEIGMTAFDWDFVLKTWMAAYCGAFSDILQSLPEGSTAAFVIHGGCIMAILEAFARPKKDFYSYHISNGAFIRCVCRDGELFIGGM